MTPIRTTYLRPWQPPPFQPSRSRGPIPRGTGPTEGGDSDRVGTVTVVVAPPGTVTPGTSVTLTAVRTGGGAALQYQWYDPTDTPIPGATGNSYTFTATASGTYKVVVDSPGAVDAPLAATVAVVVTPPAPAPWTPADDPAVLAWFDASDATKITLNAGKVSEWRSSVGTAKFAQSDSAKQPVFTAPWVKLDDTVLAMTGGAAPASISITAGLSVTGIPPSQYGTLITDSAFQYVSSTDTDSTFIYSNPAPATSWYQNGSEVIPPPHGAYSYAGRDFVPGVPFVYSAVYPQPFTTLRIGEVGQYKGMVDFAHLVFTASNAMTDALRQKLEGYMAHKIGSTAALPADHPYKAAPPTK